MSVSEHFWNSVLGEVPREGARDISEHKGNVFGQGFWEDSGQSGECVVSTDSDTRHGAIGEDENGSEGVDVLLNHSSNILLVYLVLLETSSVGQPRGVEDADLRMGLRFRTALKNTGTYHHAVLAPKFVKAGRIGLTLVVRTTLLVRLVEDFEVIVIDVLAKKHIGDVFQH